MENFLCELFDVPNPNLIQGVKDLFDMSNSTLIYSNVYRHKQIQLSLAYGYCWHLIFDGYPSKIDVYQLCMKQQSMAIDAIIDNIFTYTRIKMLINQAPPNLATRVSDKMSTFFQKMMSSSTVDEFIKSQLLFKLFWRYDPTHADFQDDAFKTHLEKHSLLKSMMLLTQVTNDTLDALKTKINANLSEIKNSKLLDMNKFTGNVLYPSNSSEILQMFTTLSPLECITYSAFKDIYFIRKLLGGVFVYVREECIDRKYIPDLLTNVYETLTKEINVMFSVTNPSEASSTLTPKLFCHPFIHNFPYALKIMPKVFSVMMHLGTNPNINPVQSLFIQTNVIVAGNSPDEFPNNWDPNTTTHTKIVLANTPEEAHAIPFSKSYHICPMKKTTTITNDNIQLWTDSKVIQHTLKYLFLCKNPYTRDGAHPHNNTVIIFDLILRYYAKLYADNKISSIKQNHIAPTSNNVVVLIDNRCNPMSVLSSYITLSNLKPGFWSMVVVTSTDTANAEYYTQRLPKNVHVIGHPLLDVKPFNLEVYNTLLKDANLWNMISEYGRYCLLIQDDGIIIKPGVEDFLFKKGSKPYDYMGAPWRVCNWNAELATMCKEMVGNGGLSFRNIDIMIKACTVPECAAEKQLLMNNNLQPIAEDVFFAKNVSKAGGIVAPLKVATDFAFEEVMNMKAFGFHKFWPYFPIQEIDPYIDILANGLKEA